MSIPKGMNFCCCPECAPHLYEENEKSVVPFNDNEESPTGRLEQWFVTDSANGFVLNGNVYDDVRKRFADGTFIKTSLVKTKEDKLAKGVTVITRNSTYLLGKEIINSKRL